MAQNSADIREHIKKEPLVVDGGGLLRSRVTAAGSTPLSGRRGGDPSAVRARPGPPGRGPRRSAAPGPGRSEFATRPAGSLNRVSMTFTLSAKPDAKTLK